MMDDLKKKYLKEPSVKKEDPVIGKASELRESLLTLKSNDVLEHYEKKHKKDIDNMMKFMKE